MTEAIITKKPVKRVLKKTLETPKASPKPLATSPSSSSLYAVFATGGKQYLVSAGDKLKIEILTRSTSSGQEGYKEGDKLTFSDVLLVGDSKGEVRVGTPFIPGSKVETIINKVGRNKKIEVIKYKQKSRYFKRYGHKQPHFEIVIDSIK